MCKNNLSDNQIDNIISILDEYARDYDHYEYGLPRDEKNMTEMRDCVKEYLSKEISE